MADSLFPIEYQDQLDAAERKRKLAQIMQQQGQGQYRAQQGGRMASQDSKLGWLPGLISNMSSLYLGKQADAETSAVKKDFSAAQDQAVATYQSSAEADQLKNGAISKFGAVRELAKQLQSQKSKQLELGVGAIKDSDPAAAFQAASSGQLPSSYQAAPIPPTSFGTSPDGKGYGITTNRKGEQNLTFAPQGISVNNILPGQEGKESLDFHKEQLKERQKGADIARDTISANSRAIDALESGARAGGGEGLKQSVRSALQAFGVTGEAGAPTEQLQQALGNELLNNARKLAPVTGTDIKVLEGILGNINSDPTALTKALAFNHAMALKALGGFNNYVTEQNQNLKNPYAKEFFSGASKGYEMPKALIGPTPFQLETVRNFQNIGGDISQFTDPVTGRSMEPGSKFNLTKPTAGFSGVQGNVPQAKTPGGPKAITQMSEAEKQAEIAQLRKQLGL